MKKFFYVLMFTSICLMIVSNLQAAEKQVVAGAGPSTKIVQLFFDHFSKLSGGNDYQFEIPLKSVKHAGGINASNTYVFGRTGRPLNAKERQMNKNEIVLAQIPVSIVVGDGVGIKTLNIKQLEQIITGQVKNWKEIGGPDAGIVVLGREEAEALFTILKSKYAFFNTANFTKVFKKDHHIVDFIKSPNGKFAIGFGAKPNFEKIDGIQIISIPDFKVGVSVGLVYDLSNENHPLIKSVRSYADSGAWAQEISEAGYLPPRS